MKAITLTQPWASLVAIGAKRIETRSWQTNYRGALAIHAAKGFPRSARRFANTFLVNGALVNAGYATADNNFPVGRVIATCQLIGCIKTDGLHPGATILFHNIGLTITEEEFAFENYEPGRFAWLFGDIRPLSTPVPATGHLGLWEWEMPDAGGFQEPAGQKGLT